MILAIQFREDITIRHERECFSKLLLKNKRIKYVSVFDENVDFRNLKGLLKGVDRVILGGSGDLYIGKRGEKGGKLEYVFDRIDPLMDYFLKNDFPVLGICFGFHLIGKYLGAKVVFDEQMAEVGFGKIGITEEGQKDSLFKKVPKYFYAVVGHQDSLIGLPENTTHLAYSDKCKIQSFRHKNNIYGTQFHPELDKNDLFKRLSLFPGYGEFAENLRPRRTGDAQKIFKNFIRRKNKRV